MPVNINTNLLQAHMHTQNTHIYEHILSTLVNTKHFAYIRKSEGNMYLFLPHVIEYVPRSLRDKP